jgi:hypothetical protein
MLHSKDIKNLSELTLTFCSKHKKSEFFTDFVSILKLGKLHACFSTAKQKGISSLHLFEILLSFPFLDQNNVHRFINSSWCCFVHHGKDAYYRLKKNYKINWRNLLLGTVKQALLTLEDCRSNLGVKAFIFDDTTIEKTGCKIEGVSRVWNHVINRTVLGYQLLVMGYYDGTMFIPINFSFHRETGKNKKRPYGLKAKHYKSQYKKKCPQASHGFKRRKELNSSKIASSVSMLKLAVKKGIVSEYVLTDSWFSCWEMVKTALENNLKYIGMFSKVKTKFTYRETAMTYKEIRKRNRKKIKRNKKFNLYYIRTVVKWNGVHVVLYFTRKGKRGNWKTLLNTELSSSFNKTVEIYQIRWSIEVFFKESKQSLGLGKSQSTDFDVQVADTTIVMMQHLFLSIKNSIEKYETLGKLFENTKAECLELKLHDRLLAILIAISEIIDKLFGDIDSQEIIARVINNTEAFEKLKLIINPNKYVLEKVA